MQGPQLGNLSLLRPCWNPANCRHGVVAPYGVSWGAKTWSGILSFRFFYPNFGTQQLFRIGCFFHFEVARGGLHFFWGVGESLGGFIKTDASIFQSSLAMIFHFAEFNICTLTAWVFQSSKDLDLHCFLLGTCKERGRKCHADLGMLQRPLEARVTLTEKKRFLSGSMKASSTQSVFFGCVQQWSLFRGFLGYDCNMATS